MKSKKSKRTKQVPYRTILRDASVIDSELEKAKQAQDKAGYKVGYKVGYIPTSDAPITPPVSTSSNTYTWIAPTTASIPLSPPSLLQGWRCPVCGRVNSPWTSTCPCSWVQDNTSPFPYPTTPPAISPCNPWDTPQNYPHIVWAVLKPDTLAQSLQTYKVTYGGCTR